MSRHVCIYSETLSAEDLDSLAERYHAAYGLPAAVRMSAPNLTAPGDWAGLLDAANPAVLRYWSAQTRKLSTMLAEAYPSLEEREVRDSILSVLAASWNDNAAGTVVYARELPDYGLAIVFSGFAVDSLG